MDTPKPSYVAYVAAFLNISSIWINHHDLFTRVRGVDARLITLNLLLLLVASLFPWPAAVISAAQRSGDHYDQIAASLLYAGIGFLVPLTFIVVYTYLARTPALLTDPAHTAYAVTNRRRALVSIVVYPVAAILAFVSPTSPWPCSSPHPSSSSPLSSPKNTRTIRDETSRQGCPLASGRVGPGGNSVPAFMSRAGGSPVGMRMVVWSRSTGLLWPIYNPRATIGLDLAW